MTTEEFIVGILARHPDRQFTVTRLVLEAQIAGVATGPSLIWQELERLERDGQILRACWAPNKWKIKI